MVREGGSPVCFFDVFRAGGARHPQDFVEVYVFALL